MKLFFKVLGVLTAIILCIFAFQQIRLISNDSPVIIAIMFIVFSCSTCIFIPMIFKNDMKKIDPEYEESGLVEMLLAISVYFIKKLEVTFRRWVRNNNLRKKIEVLYNSLIFTILSIITPILSFIGILLNVTDNEEFKSLVFMGPFFVLCMFIHYGSQIIINIYNKKTSRLLASIFSMLFVIPVNIFLYYL